MDVEDSSLRSTIERIKTVRMKDIPGENVGTTASYLKGVILLLDNNNNSLITRYLFITSPKGV